MKFIDQEQVEFFQGSVVDGSGKVFFFKNRVFRAIFSDSYAQMCRQLLSERWLDDLFNSGLIHTTISDEINLKGALLTLEHKKIPFMIHPAESTAHSFWLSAKTLININLLLAKHGYILIDAHPWNVTFDRGNPTFIDFTSISRLKGISRHWFEEFKKYYCIPIWLSSHKLHEFSKEYRREHLNGFGLKLFETKLFHKIFTFLMGFGRIIRDPVTFLRQIDIWLDEHEPKKSTSPDWPKYPHFKMGQNAIDTLPLKQKFALEVLREEKPLTVLDCAANKGYYSEMAARFGASVASFNNDERCTDQCFLLAKTKDLDITPVVMDFKLPTPPHSIGLFYGDAYERFQSEIVMALGLVHYLCIVQRLPIHIFCKICMKYAKKGILLEYIYPDDIEIKNLCKQIPENYSLEEFHKHFAKKFPKTKNSEIINNHGTKRVLAYYYL
jgi:hypothetical protein